MLDSVDLWQGSSRRSDFCAGLRWIGDKQTWTIPLPQLQGQKESSDLLPLHSFGLLYSTQLEHGKLSDPKLKYCLVDHSEWKNVYAVFDVAQCQGAWDDVKGMFRYVEALILRSIMKTSDTISGVL